MSSCRSCKFRVVKVAVLWAMSRDELTRPKLDEGAKGKRACCVAMGIRCVVLCIQIALLSRMFIIELSRVSSGEQARLLRPLYKLAGQLKKSQKVDLLASLAN